MNQYSFKIVQNYYDTGNLYTKNEITIDKGFTVLVGCNGCGKTTMMYQIQDQLRKENIEFIKFDNYVDGGSNSMSSLMWHGQMEEMAAMACSSEGERIYQNIGIQSRIIGSKFRDLSKSDKEDKTLFVLMDAMDSGFSIDNIVEVKEFIKDIVFEDAKSLGIDLFFIASANEYELANGEDCIDVRHCKHIKFKDYEEYKKLILKTREEKEARLERYRKKLEKIEANKDPWGDPHKERRRKKKDESSNS